MANCSAKLEHVILFDRKNDRAPIGNMCTSETEEKHVNGRHVGLMAIREAMAVLLL